MDFESTKVTARPFINDIIKLEPDKIVKKSVAKPLFKEENLEADNIQMDEFNYNPDEDPEFQSYLDNIDKKYKKNKPNVDYKANTQDLVSTISLISKNPDKFENTNKVFIFNIAS